MLVVTAGQTFCDDLWEGQAHPDVPAVTGCDLERFVRFCPAKMGCGPKQVKNGCGQRRRVHGCAGQATGHVVGHAAPAVSTPVLGWPGAIPAAATATRRRRASRWQRCRNAGQVRPCCAASAWTSAARPQASTP